MKARFPLGNRQLLEGNSIMATAKKAVKKTAAKKSPAKKAAAKKAKLKDYKVVEYPEKIDPLKEFLGAAKDNVSAYYAKKEFGENYVLYKQMQKAISNTGIQAKMEYEIRIK